MDRARLTVALLISAYTLIAQSKYPLGTPWESQAWEEIRATAAQQFDTSDPECTGSVLTGALQPVYEQIKGFRLNAGPAQIIEVSQVDRLNGIQYRYRHYLKITASRVFESGQWSQWSPDLYDALPTMNPETARMESRVGYFTELRNGQWQTQLIGVAPLLKRQAFPCGQMPGMPGASRPGVSAGAAAAQPGQPPAPERISYNLTKYPAAKGFVVYHDHTRLLSGASGSSWPRCAGVLYVFRDRVRFEVVASSDGARHDFEYSSRELLEVKPNVWPIQRYKAFHIKTASMVYNFVAPKNDPSEVLSALQSVKPD